MSVENLAGVKSGNGLKSKTRPARERKHAAGPVLAVFEPVLGLF